MPIQRPQSLSSQVNALLRQRIHDRVYPPGGRLPSESDLAQEMGVSRATIRTVLAKLAGDGLILRKQGDGTYVNERIQAIDARYGGLWDFSRLIAANGLTPRIEMYALEIGVGGEEAAVVFPELPEEPYVHLQRLFFADETAVIHADNLIPERLFIQPPGEIDGACPLHQILHRYSGERIAYAVTKIGPARVPGELTAVFHSPSDKLFLKIDETFFNKDNQPLVYGSSYLDQERVPLRLVQAWG